MFVSKNLTAGQLNALVKIIGGEGTVRDLLDGTVKLVIKAAKLLKRVTTTSVSGAKEFVAKDVFKPNNLGRIKFWLGNNFQTQLLGKIEKNVPDAKLAISVLAKSSKNMPIMAELGDQAETALAYLYELISRQPRGEVGPLLTDGRANIFYIRDANSQFWVVYTSWFSTRREWCLDARFVEYPYPWYGGRQVVSQVSS